MAMTEVLKHTNWTLRTKLSVRSKDGEIIRVIAFVYWLLLLSNYLIKNNKKMTIIMTLFIAMNVIISYITICNFSIAVPSLPPSGFTLAASTSTSITASWQLPPKDSRNGIITGYKLFYKKKGSLGPASMQPINSQATRSQKVTRLDKYTEYEFQILAFTSVGDGPKSKVVYEKTKEAGKK